MTKAAREGTPVGTRSGGGAAGINQRTSRSRSLAGLILAGLLLAASPVTAEAGAAESCSLNPTNGLEPRSIGVRTYQLYVPQSVQTLEPGTPVPLLVSLHGLGGSGSRHAGNTQWALSAEARRFIVVFPDGVRSWQLGEGSPDVAFVRAVVDDVSNSYCIDGGRVNAVGHSNGGQLVQRLACDASDLFAAFAVYAGARPSSLTRGGPCGLERPVDVAFFWGEDDPTFEVGKAARDWWVVTLDCDTVPEVESLTDGVSSRYPNCLGGAEVSWRSYEGQGHPWPDDEGRRADLNGRILDFLDRHSPTSLKGPGPSDSNVWVPDGVVDGGDIGPAQNHARLSLVSADEPLLGLPFAARVRLTTDPDRLPGVETDPTAAEMPLADRTLTASFGSRATEAVTDHDGIASLLFDPVVDDGEVALRVRFAGDIAPVRGSGQAAPAVFKLTFGVEEKETP